MSNAPRLLANPTTRFPVRLLLAIDFDGEAINDSTVTPEAIGGVVSQLAAKALASVEIRPKQVLAGVATKRDTTLTLRKVVVGARPPETTKDRVDAAVAAGAVTNEAPALRVVCDEEPEAV